MRPRELDGTPKANVAGDIIYRFMVDIPRLMLTAGGRDWVDALYADPPIPQNAPSATAIDVLGQTGFQKVRKVCTSMWNQYKLTQKDVEDEEIQDKLVEWGVADARAMKTGNL